MSNASRGEFKLNNFEDGVLSSAFMVGLLVASPIFASLAKRYALLYCFSAIFSLKACIISLGKKVAGLLAELNF